VSDSASTSSAVQRRPVTRVTGRSRERVEDAVAVERALEIRVDGRALAVTLRTPGHDAELASGFLAGEGLLRGRADLAGVTLSAARCADEPDLADVTLAPGVPFDWTRFERHFAATSACGLCGRAHLDALRAGLTPVAGAGRPTALPLERLHDLPARVRALQAGFAETGGLHAAVLCDAALEPLVLREDVGRHNAVDKLCGWLLAQGRYGTGGAPLAENPNSAGGPLAEDRHGNGGALLWVSGRAGAEIVLKAARAGIPALAAVGAPTSLAIELAEAARMTLIGFVREGRMNVYAEAGAAR
jgi:FdhD protein